MSCLTPEGAMSGDCDFLSANMYARSLFGEFLFLVIGGSALVSYMQSMMHRRGCFSKSQHREDGGWHCGSRSDPEQDARHCVVAGRPYHDV